MADETHDPNSPSSAAPGPDASDTPGELDEQPAEQPAGGEPGEPDVEHDDADGADEGDDWEAEQPLPPSAGGRVTLSVDNQSQLGRLVLHFAARDVVLWFDGDAAMRLLDIYRHHRNGGPLAERFHPATSSASNGWLAVDLEQPDLLAVSWEPGLPTRLPRTVIDPAMIA